MERKYYVLILVAFFGGFAAGAITVKMMKNGVSVNRFIPTGKVGFEAFDTVTGQECVSVSVTDAYEHQTEELVQSGKLVDRAMVQSPVGNPLIQSHYHYHGMPYCSELARK